MLVYARVLQKWDYATHRYRQILVPVDWNCKTYTEDFQEVVNCPHCGKELPFMTSAAMISFDVNP